MQVQVTATGVSKLKGTVIGPVDITEIGRVGKDVSLRHIVQCLRRENKQVSMKHSQQHHDALDTFRQSEEEARTPTLLTLGRKQAYTEQLAHLSILLDDALAIHQSEAMGRLVMIAVVENRFVVEYMSQAVCIHATPRITDREFDVCFVVCSADGYPPPFVRKLAGIVGKGVEHEQCQHPVCLDYSLCGFYDQRYTFHVKTGASSVDEFEKRLKAETLYVKAQLTLTQLNPLRQQVVLFVDFVRQFADVIQVFLVVLLFWIRRVVYIPQMVHRIEDAVNEWRYAIDERHFGTLLQMAAFQFLQVQTTYMQFVGFLLQYVVQLVVILAFPVQVIE